MAGCNLRILPPIHFCALFQSSPGAMAGCNQFWMTCQMRCEQGFNPHPARWPGATPVDQCFGYFLQRVSILTRRDGRVQPTQSIQPTLLSRFQSSPGAMAGCNKSVAVSVITHSLFQSSPGAMAGCNTRPTPHQHFPSHGFNPHPARWPGATYSTSRLMM
jgi:hypothetical protein